MQSMHVIRSQCYHPLILLFGLVFSVCAHAAPPTFSMAFSPSTIGPGDVSTLTYTINNSAEAVGVSGLTFTHTLATGITIANPSRASTSCVDGVLTAAVGAGSVSIDGYRLSSASSCTFTVDVTSATPGAHVNTTGALATSAGSAGTAAATLTVDAARPGMSMAFSPSTINQGAVSTLIYTVDNSLNGSNTDLLTFNNTLPNGVVISDQPSATTTCTGGAATPEITAVAAASTISLTRAFVAAGASCTVSVNVTAANTGQYTHVGGSLSRNGSNPSGTSTALLTVANPFISASFPASVAPGQSVTLRYTLNNTDRDNVATGITFTNDLNATLSGLTATVLPANDFCGSGSTLTGSSNLTLAGANLASGASCSFEVTVAVPANAATGTYTNNTSIINLTLGSATTESAYSHSLVVSKSPLLTMSFIDDPAVIGGNVTLRYTLTNTDTANTVSAITFTQEIDSVYPGITIATLPNANSCGVGSTFTGAIPVAATVFTFNDGSLTAGANCTFDVILTLPSSGPPGRYLHTTSTTTSTLNGATLTGNKAADTLVVLAAPRLSIALDSYALPGATVTAEFSLTYSETATADSTGLAFSIDLDSVLTGLTMTSATANDICGAGSSVSGTSTVSFVGGSLAADAQCRFSVTLQIPSGAVPGTYTMLSSTVTGTTAAQSVTSAAVSDTVTVSGLTLSKAFLTNNLLPGDSVTARYTITNSASALAATDIAFTDRLHQSLSSLAATSLPSTPCGVGSTITGTTTLTVSGGNLDPGTSCTFDVPLLIPGGTSAGIYNVPTSAMSATVGGNNTEAPSAVAVLYVEVLSTLITSSASNPALSSPIPVAIYFDRSVVNFVVGDLTITNGSASNFSGSGQSFSLDVTPTTEGSVVISLPANSVDDAANGSVQNGAESLTIVYAAAPANVAVTVPANAVNSVGSSYTVSGTHSISNSKVYLYADSNNDGIADNATILATDTAVDGTWSMTATLAFQVANNFVVAWGDRENRVSRSVNVPTITEVTPNYDPIISGSPSTSVAEDSGYSFTPTMTDANSNDTHLFSVTNAPSWASFDTATGALTGTPVNADVGTTSNIVITVTDSSSLSASLAAFNLTVSNTNDAPVISGAPSTTAAEDAAYSFTPTVSDVDVGDTQTFSISNPPSWASFSTSTGVLSGTPSNDDIGLTSNIVITVTDSASATDSLTAFNITVSNTNDAPVISGTPATAVAEDSAYSFTPAASDVDSADTATFSITNQPTWASFDTATGVLSGTPVNGDVGLTSNIVITVTDAASASDSLAAFNITVNNTNDAPVISGTPSTTVAEDSAYSFTPAVSDIDSGDTTTFSIANPPSWASFSTSTGVLSGTPSNDDIGVTSNIVITVTDSASATDSLAAFSLAVTNTNDAPVISGTPSTAVAEDASYSFTPVVTDVDSGDTTTFSITNPPSWASFDTATGVLSGTPNNDDIGLTSNIVITVTDTASASDSLAAFNITVSNTNDAPVISGTPSAAVAEDAAYSFTPGVSDVDSGDTATFSITNQPSWASFDTATGALTGTPTNADVGTNSNIVITVTDSASATDSLTAFNITVTNTNDAPVISGTPGTSVAEDASYSFTPALTDVDSADTATFSITNQPSWASFNTATGALTGIPTNDNVGLTSNIVITVTDAASASDSLAAFNIAVSNTNDTPVISGTPDAAVAEDAAYSFTPTASDVDSGDTATFSITNQPTWASFDTATGALTGTPSNSNVGLTSNIVITVTDAASASASLSAFSISVSNTNDAPIISGTPGTAVAEDASYSFTPTVTDVDSGDTVTFSISNPPSWASFDTSTGALTGTPTNSDIGLTSNIVITVVDAASASDSLAAFNITVSNTNDAPTISGTPDTAVAEDAAYSFTPTAADVDSGDTATFSITNQPTWASFDTATGALTGTPSNSDVGLNSNIVITVTDAASASASLSAFSISVSNTNDAPSISGTPDTTVAEDSTYTFAPVVTDVDSGDTSSFSIANQPSWASFDTATGALTGTPTNSDIGLTSNIVITVTDSASATASLAAFNIAVSNTNDAPVITGTPSATVDEDASYSFTPVVTDVDSGDTASFSIVNQPSWASFDANTGALTGTPNNSNVGLTTGIVITVSDGAGAEDSLAPFSISVSNTNDALVISGSPSTSVDEDASYSFTPTVTDVDSGDTTLFSITNKPVWANFDTDTGALTGTPTNTHVGLSSNIVISVTDSGGAISSLAAFDITVNNTNDAPVITGSPASVIAEDANYSFVPSIVDPDAGDTYSVSITNKPSWASFDSSTGALTGTPSNSDVGVTAEIVISVSDAAGAAASLSTFSITVTNTNDALVISGTPDTLVAEDASYSFTPLVNDEDSGDTVVFSINNKPTWASFDTATGALTGVPNNGDVGLSANIVISASDSGGAISSLAAFDIVVSNTNDAPVISGVPGSTVAEDSIYSFTPVVSDVDSGDTFSFTISNKPNWAVFDSAVGTLAGTPTNSDIGLNSEILITVTDAFGATASLAAFSITVSNTNDAPVISGTPNTTVAEDALYSFTPGISDEDSGDSVLFSITNTPAWASFNTSTGELTGTPNNSHVGLSANIVITATDSAAGTSSLPAFSITVSNTNDAPVISGTPNAVAVQGLSYSFTPVVSDVDTGDVANFSITNKPAWASFNASTGTLAGTPSNEDVGTSSAITISVSDSAGATASLAAFSIAVSNTNDAPILTGTPATTVAEDATYRFTPQVTDVDVGDTLSFSIINMPSWSSFNVSTGELTGTPVNSDVGITEGIVITASDAAGATSSTAVFSITVSNANDGPVIGGTPNPTVNEDERYRFTPVVSDDDAGDTVAFSIANKPIWIAFNTVSGALRGTPRNSDVGVHSDIVISATDSGGAVSILTAFSITVVNVNDAPVIGGAPGIAVAEDASYLFAPEYSDVDSGDSATFSITNQPIWVSFDVATGVLSGTPSNADVGVSSNIVISVTDSAAAVASLEPFSITVSNTNDVPDISGAPNTTVAEDAQYSFTPTVVDIDQEDTTTFSIENKPLWATFDTSTGALTGSPANADVGVTRGIAITVSDAAGAMASLAVFDITVVNSNDAPVISGEPSLSVAEDTLYSFTPLLADEDVGDTLTASVLNQPAWASFDTTTGALFGTPNNADVGIYEGIEISVSDGVGSESRLAVFSITVSNTNDVPVISGSPDTSVEEDAAYSFTPIVSDDDIDDSHSFSITGLPSWATFDTATGTLAGTPGSEYVAIYGNIEITVTDSANGAASLAVFSINVININDAPEISGSPETSVNEDATYSFTPTVTDADDADIKKFSVVNQPSWLTLNPSNGALTGVPSDEDIGLSENIVITVTDIAGASDSLPAFNILVVNINDAPIAVDDDFVMSPSTNGYLLDVLQNDTDADGDLLTLLSYQTPVGSLDIEDGQLRFTPGADIRNVVFEYAVSDGHGAQAVAVVRLSITANDVASPGPIIEVPDDIEINATGLFTRVDLGVATAVDAQGNALAVTLLNETSLFASGSHKVYWRAEDQNGNVTVREQALRIKPLVSFTKGQQAIENSTLRVGIILSGESPEYPFTVNYLVSGSADEGDHSLVDGSVTLTSPRGFIEFEVYQDGVPEDPETIILRLADDLNHGAQNTHSVEIVERNIAPQISLKITQNGEPRSLVDQNGGLVVVSATVIDVNPDDTHTLSWQFAEEITDLDDSDNSFSFEPADLGEGLYAITLTATDTGTPQLATASKAYFEVISELPVLTEQDTDGDLIPDDIEGLGDYDNDGIPDYLDSNDTGNVMPSNLVNQAQFLLEGPAGSKLRKGLLSGGNEGGGALLNQADASKKLVTDVVARNVGGIFDFVLEELPVAGQSYSVVLPQQEALPAQALYRKYLSGVWYDFVIDENNGVYSAAGERGYCPPPGAAVWQPGLTEGHWCVQLTLEDGGPNDDDGLVNSTIVDPGGVAVALSDNHIPVAVDDNAETTVGVIVDVSVLVNDTDEDGDELSLLSTTANLGLSEIIESGGQSYIRYTPPEGFIGSDFVIYSVSDGNGGTANSTLTINIKEKPKVVVSYTPPNRRSRGGSFGWLSLLVLCAVLAQRHYRLKRLMPQMPQSHRS